MARLLALLAALSLANPVAAGDRAATTVDAATETELKALRTQLLDALEARDRDALDRLLAEGFAFVHSTGVMERRDAFIARSVAAPAARAKNRNEFLDDDLRRYGDTVVWVTRSRRVAPAPVGELNFRGTDVLVRLDGRWQWASVQSTRLPTRPVAIEMDAESAAAIVGRWQVAPGRIIEVTGDAANLRAAADGARVVDLVPTAPGEFAWFDPESNLDVRVTLVRGSAGEPAVLVMRRESLEAWRAQKLAGDASQ